QDIGIGGDVVGAEDVHAPVEAALQFVHVVGDVGQAVGGLTGAFHEHGVFLFAEGRGAVPDRPVLVVHQVFGPQAVEHAFQGAVAVQVVFVEEVVHADLHALQGALDVGEDAFFGDGLEGRVVLGEVGAHAMTVHELAGDVPDVFAFVPALGEVEGLVEADFDAVAAGTHQIVADLAVAGGHAFAQ